MGGFSRDVLFIHIPKCGGWSVKTYMAEHLPGFKIPQDSDGTISDHNLTGFPIGHIPLRDVERYTGRPPESWDMIVATIRNPYKQQLSQWLYWLNRYHRGRRHYHDLIARLYDNLTEFLMDPRCDFHLWYERIYGEQNPSHSKYRKRRQTYEDFGGMYRYWLEVDGQIPDNVEIVKLEELSDRLPAVLQPYADHDLPVPPRKNAVGRAGEWAEYYTPKAMEIVNRKAQWAFTWHYEPLMMEVEE